MRRAISVQERLLVTLRFLATGDSYASSSYLFRIPECTISGIVPEVCKAITNAMMKLGILKAPAAVQEWQRICDVFAEKWHFPRCAGSVDEKHITIQAPSNSGSYFFNYKSYHSTVLMAVVDAQYSSLAVNVGCNGRISDVGVFAASGIPQYLERQLCRVIPAVPLPGREMPLHPVVIGDEAFPLRPYLMKPYARNTENCNVTRRVFNLRLARARNIVENTFWVMSAVFRVLRKPLLLKPDRVDCVVVAVCCLHNYMMSRKSTRPPDNMFDQHNAQSEVVVPGTWRAEGMPDGNMLPLGNVATHNYSRNAKEIRDEYRSYFISPAGEITWQYTRV